MIFENLNVDECLIVNDDILMHYGMPRRSGRYPWGSGENPFQRTEDFLARIDKLKKNGYSEKAIADDLGLTILQYRTQKSLASAERRQLLVERAESLKADGLNNTEIARAMGFKNDSSVRSLLNKDSKNNMNQALETADFIREQIDSKGMIDIGKGVESELHISKERLDQALYILELEGYKIYGGRVPQVTNKGQMTTIKVIGPPDTEHKDIFNFEKVSTLQDYISPDGGDTFEKAYVYPKSMDISRLKVRYAEEGGDQMDGVIQLRRGVPDLSLGDSVYSQVRILVDGDRYLKGMAVYSDDMPKGVDVIFNTNKSKGTPVRDTLKEIKDDPNNPFGSLIKAGISDPDIPHSKGGQSYYYDKNGNKQLSLINKRADEGDWSDWKEGLPSQFLGKQSIGLIKKQLSETIKNKDIEYKEIIQLTNPSVKKAMLETFANDCDSAAVHLKAASLPRTKHQVILPIPSMKDTECYAPNYKNGEKLALIRFPHGGTFEIPIVTVNNKQTEAVKMLGKNPKDVICINAKVASILSGADFDGDTVMAIPTGGKINIKSKPPLKELEGFDTKMAYGGTKSKNKEGQEVYIRNGKEYKIMRNTQNEMGRISNLITDMTLKGATDKELSRAVKHSMVVIDAEKHKLDYQQSYKDNQIAVLKRKYLGDINPETGNYSEGASTLLSRAKSEKSILKTQGSPKVNIKGTRHYDPTRPEGALLYKNATNKDGSPASYINKAGKEINRTQRTTKMADVDDARILISKNNTQVEQYYAQYANHMKALANSARKESIFTKPIPLNREAQNKYKVEVKSIKANILMAEKNAPRERKAQLLANSIIQNKKKDNPDMTKSEIKKAEQQALTYARNKVGAKRYVVPINDREWSAIQAGAVSATVLNKVIKYADVDVLRQRATPKPKATVTKAMEQRIKSMASRGYTNSEISEALSISASTVSNYL